MYKRLKRAFYFPIAGYFRFFAQIQLMRWKPRIVVVTGSSGKTTTLHFIAAQLGTVARYSYHANSAFGIPFDILGLQRSSFRVTEWLKLCVFAPFCAFKRPFSEKIYIVEADCDRPGEGAFLARLLNPEVTLWVSCSRSHSMNFDDAVGNRGVPNVETVIAREFGFFLQFTRKLVVVNADSPLIVQQLKRTHARVQEITKTNHLQRYELIDPGTIFEVDGQKYVAPFLLPEDTFYSIAMTSTLLNYFEHKKPFSFAGIELPPGRSSVFVGMKHTTLIDSTYNATFDGMKTILEMFAKFPAKKKWVVIGDMLEQGKEEQEEHEKLAMLLSSIHLSQIVLMGPRVSRYTYPKLRTIVPAVQFENPREALDFLLEKLQGDEVVLFKGARFLEGVVEHLLLNKSDASKLCRREPVWQQRRKEWGL